MIFKLFFFWYYFAVCLKYILAIVRKVDYILAILRKVDYVLLLSCENRILQWGEDCRFDEMRNNLGKLAVFWIFQVSSEFTTPFFFGYIICILPEAQEEDSPICSHLQAVWVWTVSLPLTVVNASDRDPSVKPQDIIGWLMWVVGIIVEATADQQKLAFKNSPANKGKWCNIGLWKYSRHPNYFGEVSFIGSSTFLFTFSLL